MTCNVSQHLQAAMRARALAEGHTIEQETRIAMQYHVDHTRNQGEMRHPEDITIGGEW
jgi:plasmid stability protein